MKKKILSMLLVMTMMVSFIPANIITAVSAESMAVLTVETPWANPGDTVDVHFTISENPGILGATITVSWDESLTLIADASGKAFSHMTYISPSHYAPAGTNFVWYGNETNETVDGTALNLTFTIPEGAENNNILPIRVTYTHGDVIDGNDQDVALSITDGYVRVITYTPGDATNDSRVDSRDLVRLSQYISDGCATNPEGYNAEVIADACDVNGDGRINARDLIRLSQYISDGSWTDPNGYNAVLNPAQMPTCGHPHTVKTDYQASSCINTGNIAYWYCPDCAKYFADAEWANEIAYTDTVIAKADHAVVIDEAIAPDYENTGLTEGSHCGVCNEVIIAQQTVPTLEATYHAIIYRNLQGAESPEINQFAEHEGLAFEDVPEPVRAGYTFLGWYTASEGGTKVDAIKAGTTDNFEVYAHWKLTTYTINYSNAAENANPETYTVEDEINLATPEWAGLIFSRWTDQNGETVTKIAKGTTGNIELEANWIYAKNLAVSNPDKYTYIGGAMDSQSRYYFIYDIGTIENIVLDTKFVEKYRANTSIDRTESVTYKVQKAEAQSAAQSIANSVIKSDEWENTSEWISLHQESSNFGAKYCPEIEINKVKAKLYEITGGWSEIDEEKYTETNTQMSSEVNGTEITNQTVSSISFLTENETTSTVRVQLTKGVSPVGIYSYVRAADVKVYAIVTHDPANGEYYLDIYSQVCRVFDTVLFELSGDDQYNVNIESRDQLDFEIPYAQIPEKFYTVKYDANGGTGKMLNSVHEVGVSSAVLPNAFTRTGYTFGGWKTTKNETSTLYLDSAAIRDIASAGETITLYAHWVKNAYTVKYDANPPSAASSSVLNMPQNKVCKYDEPVTLGSKPSLTGWTFDGWYNAKTGGKLVGKAGETTTNLTSQQNTTVTLYAQWKANTYTVKFNADGGTCSTASQSCTYDTSYSLPTVSKKGYTFLGWTYNGKTYSEIKNLATSGTITMTAQWKLITEYSMSKTPNATVKGDYNHNCQEFDLSSGLDVAELKKKYSHIRIDVTFRCEEQDDGYQEIYLSFWRSEDDDNGIDESFASKTDYNGGPGSSDKNDWTFSATTSTSGLDKIIYVWFSAHGTLGDDWILRNVNLKVTFY